MAELNYGEASFSIHQGRSPNRGSRIANVLLVVVLLGIGGVAYYVFADAPRLVQHIAAEDPIAVPAAYALAFKGKPLPEGAVPVLKKGLDKGGSPSLRAACAKALAVAESPELVTFLGDAATRDPDAGVRAAAVEALAINGGGVGTPRFLKAALEDDDETVQAAACRAVGDLELRQLIPRLIDFLGFPSRNLREAAQAGLEKFLPDGSSFGTDQARWSAWYDANR